MKRVIKANISGFDKLIQVESPQYDPDWQEHIMQEIADKLDPYGLDVEIDSSTDEEVFFTVVQPQYPDVKDINYSTYKGVTISELHGKNGYNISTFRKIDDILDRALSARFDKYLGNSPEFVSALQAQLDEVMVDLDEEYNMQSELIVKKITIDPYRWRFEIWLDDDSHVDIDQTPFPMGAIWDKYCPGIHNFVTNASVSAFLDFVNYDVLYELAENDIIHNIDVRFLRRTNLLPAAIDKLNAKLARSRYHVTTSLYEGTRVKCDFNHMGRLHSFSIDADSESLFDIWFKGSHRDYDGAVDFLVRTIYKRITAKCRRLAVRLNQEAEDSAML